MLSWSTIGETLLSSLQASISVILVLLYGYLIRKWKYITQEAENGISKVSVTWFLPALLFAEIGPLATWENIKSYWIIIALSLIFQLGSWGFGIIGYKFLKLPQWIIPCLIFNNVTSLPLLLISSLRKTGTLDALVKPGDTMDEMMKRGRVYILINALVCNLTRFTFGPYLMTTHDPRSVHHARSHLETPHMNATDPSKFVGCMIDHDHDAACYPEALTPIEEEEGSEEELEEGLGDVHGAAETTALIAKKGKRQSKKGLDGLIYYGKKVGKGVWGFMNPPMWGGLAAVVGGMMPYLRDWLFDDEGWLSPFTQSMENIGNLYTVLQMFVLGAHLYSKKTNARPPILAMLYLFGYRFFLMPVISSATVYGLRLAFDKDVGIKSDPMLDFTMALTPVGPPALTLAAIVEMSDSGEEVQAAVAQTILLSYIVTPIISFSISGVLAVVQDMYPQ